MRKHILIPFLIAIIILPGAMVVGVYQLQQRYIESEVRSRVAGVQKLFQTELKGDTELLNGLIGFIKDDKALQTAWLAKDRNVLFRDASRIFENIRQKHRVTHFYFHDVEGVCFLRVHMPQRYGDYIYRFTMDEAVQNKKPSYGIELGPLGTFTLRTVHPWRINGNLVGYIELGEEIEHITPKLREITGAELLFVIDKAYLDRAQWEQGMKMLDRKADWNQFSDFVIVGQTVEQLPPALGETMQQHHVEHEKFLFKTLLADRQYQGGFVPLFDAGRREVGEILVMYDVTEVKAQMRILFMPLIAIWIIFGALLFILIHFYVGRIERRVEKVSGDLVAEIKEHERSEEALTEERNLMFKLMDNLPHYIYVKDTNSRFVTCNKALLKALQAKTFDDVLGKTDFDFFPKEMAEKYYADEQQVIKSGQPMLDREEPFMERGGEKRWGLTTKVPLRDSKGQITGILGIGRDITERKIAEQSLRIAHDTLEMRVKRRTEDLAEANENLEREIAEHKLAQDALRLTQFSVDKASDAVFWIGSDAKFLYVNDATIQILGYSRDELLSMTVHDIDPNFPEEVWPGHWKKIRDLKSFTVESTHRKKDGTIFPVEISVNYLEFEGKELHYAFVRDITARKQAEENLQAQHNLLRTLIDNLPDSIYVKDSECKFVVANTEVARRTGVETPDKLIGKSDFDFYSSEDAAKYHANEQIVLDSGQPLINLENQLVNQTTGEVIWNLTNKVPLKDNDGKVIGLVGIGRDITDQKQLESEVERYKERVYDAQKSVYINSMGAIVAHQLNQPLSVINILLDQVIADYEQDSHSQDILKNLKTSLVEAEKATEAINRFRKYSKDPLFNVTQQVNIGNIAKRIASALSEKAEQAKLEILIKDIDSLPQIQSNEAAVEQIFFIIMQNAIDAADDQKQHNLTITAKTLDGKIELQFSDDCCGIAPENLEKIFEPFFTTKGGTHGMGLGLEIVKRILIGHGGEIRVESEPAKGSTFYIVIPVVT